MSSGKRFWILLLSAMAIISAALLPVGAKTTELSFWFANWNEPVRQWLEGEAIPAFTKENPNVKINVTYTGWNDYEDKLFTSYAGGSAPDVFMSAVEWPPKLRSTGIALPLDSYIKKWGQEKDFFPPAWENGVWRGVTYSVPWSVGVRTHLYRKDIFSEQGINPNRGPETWDELLQYAKKLLKKNDTALERYGVNRVGAQELLSWVWITGGEVLDPTYRRSLLGEPPAIKAMELALALHNLQHPSRTTAYGSISELLNGKVAIHWDEFRPIQAFPASGVRPEDIGLSKPPRDVTQGTPVFAAGLSVASSTPNPDLAWKFVEFLLRPDQLLAYNKAFGRNVPRRSLLSHPYFNQDRIARENLQLLAEYGRPWVRTDANWMDLQNRLLAEMNKAFAMQSTPKQAMEDTAQYWNTALAAATIGK